MNDSNVIGTVPSKRQVKRDEAQQQKRRSTRNKIIAVVVAVAVVALVGLLLFMNSDAYYRVTTAATIGDRNFSAAEVNYFYNLSFDEVYNTLVDQYGETYAGYFVDPSKSLKTQNYSEGVTWADYIQNVTLNNLQSITMLNNEGKKAGYEFTDEQKTTLEERYALPASQAATYSMDVPAFLTGVYGKGVNEEVYRSCMELAYYAGCYSESKNASYTFTQDEMQTKYDEDPSAFDQVTYRMFNVKAETGEDVDTEAAMAAAKEKADAFAASVTDEASFASLSLENAAEADKANYEKENATRFQFVLKSSVSADYADWLFDAGRAEGDVTVVEGTNAYSVVYFIARNDTHYNTVNVRHILISPEIADSTAGATDKEMALAKNEAEAVMKQWQEGDATEDSFAELAKTNSKDSGSNKNGGLYENVRKGQMVEAFNNWCFDGARKAGDVEIVETEYGYHIMYFVGAGEEYWTMQLDDTLRSAAYDAWSAEALKAYPVSTAAGLRYVKLVARVSPTAQ